MISHKSHKSHYLEIWRRLDSRSAETRDKSQSDRKTLNTYVGIETFSMWWIPYMYFVGYGKWRLNLLAQYQGSDRG